MSLVLQRSVLRMADRHSTAAAAARSTATSSSDPVHPALYANERALTAASGHEGKTGGPAQSQAGAGLQIRCWTVAAERRAYLHRYRACQSIPT